MMERGERSSMRPKDLQVSIVIPTYNEAANIGLLVKKIHRSLQANYEVIIVDDSSPDGTGKIAENLSKSFPLRVIHRKGKLGLGSAVLAGFEAARGEVLGVMDADLQHPPDIVPELVRIVNQGADIAIGSRYVPNGGFQNFASIRKLASKLATLAARPLVRVKDPMSGFFFLRRKVVEDVALEPRGYKILLEILVKGKYKEVVEIPYLFADRKLGQSKLDSKVALSFLQHLVVLYFSKTKRFRKFCIVGLTGIFVNMFFLWLLAEVFGLFYLVAGFIAVELSIINNFTWNNIWTFKEVKDPSHVLIKLGKFNLVSLSALVVNMSVLYSFTRFLHIYYLISNLFGIGAAFLWNYTMNARWTWRETQEG